MINIFNKNTELSVFTITTSFGQSCRLENFKYFYRGIEYDEFWKIGYKKRSKDNPIKWSINDGVGFNLDESNPFYIIQWVYKNIPMSMRIEGRSCKFFIDKKSHLLFVYCKKVVVFNHNNGKTFVIESDSEIHNNYFLNLDGSLNHQLKSPKYIYNRSSVPSDTFLPRNKLEEMTAFTKAPVEGIGDVRFDEQRNSLSVYLNFHYDWFQERLYNAETQEWGEIVSAGRY